MTSEQRNRKRRMLFEVMDVRCILTLLLVASFASSQVFGDLSAADGNDPNFYNFIRPRLGHFSRAEGYLKIFEDYKANVLALNDKQLATLGVNDWRNYRPTGELCVDFLMGFEEKDYTLVKPFEIIILDACLDWLYDDSREKKLDMDRFNENTKADNEKLSKDPELKKFYTTTKFKGDKIPKELKDKLKEYFDRLMQIHAENPTKGCNGLYLAAYDDFIEDVYLGDCEDDDDCEYFGKYAKFNGIKKEPYLNLIVDSTKQATKNCYSVVQKQMVAHMHQAYEDEPLSDSIKRKFKQINSSAAKQSTEKKWGREMMRILQLTSNKGADDVVDLREVVKVLKGVKEDDEEIKESFTESVSAYATKELDTKDSAGDANGRARYGKAMRDLCKPYIDKQSFLVRTGGSHLWTEDPTSKRKPFEFFELVYSLIRITNHMSFYKITKEKFENDVIKNGWEALYMATYACQLISTTWGELSYDTNKAEFSVKLRKSYHDLIDDWPIEVMNDEYMKKAPAMIPPKSPARDVIKHLEDSSGGKGRFGFGRFKLGRKSSKKDSDEESDYEQEQDEATQPPMRKLVAPRSPNRARKTHTKEPEPEEEIDDDEEEPEDSTPPPRRKLPVRRPIRGRKAALKEPEPEDEPEPEPEPELEPEVEPEPERQPIPSRRRPAKTSQTSQTPTLPSSVPSAPSRGGENMSLDSIEMFRKLHGKFPKLSESAHRKYSNHLPEDLSGTYEKELGTEVKKEKSKVLPLAFNLNQGFDPTKAAKQTSASATKPKFQAIDPLSM